jgi:hypothetical protein
VGDWYTIGLALGLGLGFGVILSGLLAANAVGTGIAVVFGVAAGGLAGYAIGDTTETIAGIVGGLIGALAAAVVVLGAMRRGATRLGVGTYVGSVGVLIVLLSLIPIVGYVVTVVLPALALRMRGRQAARYAGLRTLAK